MQELNSSFLSGNISDVIYATTEKKADPAASFTLFVDNSGDDNTTLVRVNVFGSLVLLCKDRGLKGGDYVIVEGALMNRLIRSNGFRATEIKAKDIKILNQRSVSNERSS